MTDIQGPTRGEGPAPTSGNEPKGFKKLFGDIGKFGARMVRYIGYLVPGHGHGPTEQTEERKSAVVGQTRLNEVTSRRISGESPAPTTEWKEKPPSDVSVEKVEQVVMPVIVPQPTQVKVKEPEAGPAERRQAMLQVALGVPMVGAGETPSRGVTQRVDLFKECVSAEDAGEVLDASKRFAFVNVMVKELQDGYLMWSPDDELSEEQRAQLRQAHQNLDVALKLIKDLAPDERDLLRNVTTRDLAEKGVDFFAIANGEKILSGEALTTFKEAIDTSIANQKVLEDKRTPLTEVERDAITKLQPTHPELQISLAERTGRSFLLFQPGVSRMGTSANTVVRMGPEGVEAKGYFKLGKEEDESTGIMEKFVFDAAMKMGGLENFFVPTSRIPAVTSADIAKSEEESVEIRPVITQSGELRQVPIAASAAGRMKGGVQISQEGQLVKAAGLNSVPTEELFKAALMQVAFGMFDAHGSNVIVSPEGHLKYFDNASSFPHSNRVINWSDCERIPFRSCLLESPYMYAQITVEGREFLKSEAAEWAKRLDSFKAFLNSEKTQRELQGLPPKWFDSEKVYNAMEERVENMVLAVDNPEVTSMRDVLFACYPELKFYAVLELLSQNYEEHIKNYPSQGIQQAFLPRLGYDFVPSLLQEVAEQGFNVKAIKELCDGFEGSFDDLLSEVLEKTKCDGDTAMEEGQNLYRIINRDAVPDYKDISPIECIATSLQEAGLSLGYRVSKSLPSKIPLGQILIFKDNSQPVNNNKFLVFRDDEGKLHKEALSLLPGNHLIVTLDNGQKTSLRNRLNQINDNMCPFLHPGLNTAAAAHAALDELNDSWLVRPADVGAEPDATFVVEVSTEGRISSYEGELTAEGKLSVKLPGDEEAFVVSTLSDLWKHPYLTKLAPIMR